jgi:hypothetical protein
LGIRHPNPDVESGDMAQRAIALSQDLDLYDKYVFFNDWTPYEERQNYLLEADAGASLHFSHVETHFSFRTRLLDHLWASLPTIVTRGDVLSDLITQHQLGWVVDYGDVDGVAAAILESAGIPRDQFQPRFGQVAPQLRWAAVLEPLVAFCQDPRPAPDRQRARVDLQSMPALKLISQMNALRRDISAKEAVLGQQATRIKRLEAQVQNLSREAGHLRQTLEQVEQGRVMRLLNGMDRLLKGGESKQP